MINAIIEQKTKNINNQNVMNLTNIFTQKQMIVKRNTKQQDQKPNILNDIEQKKLLEEIVSRVYNIQEKNNKCMLIDLYNGRTAYIEKNYKNFKEIVSSYIENIVIDGFETINLPKLFEHLKSRVSYEYKEYRSVFFKKDELVTDEKAKSLNLHIKINYAHDLSGIDIDTYKDIVSNIEKHWNNKIDSILDFIVASKFATDKKSLWLLILANSNFGKSKLFKWMEKWDGTAFMDFEDIIGKGINDRKPEDYYNKMCLVVDEVLSFHRELFKIEDVLNIRPMNAHTVSVPINSRILLSADGGQFNDEHLDSQITNRVSKIDLRNIDEELGNLEIVKKYGHNKIERVMSHFLYTELINKLNEYETVDRNFAAEKADSYILTFNEDNKIETKNFYEAVSEIMEEFVASPEATLGQNKLNLYEDDLITTYIHKGDKGILIKRPQSVLMEILVHLDSSLKYELQYKKVKQIADNIPNWKLGKFKFAGKTVSALFIAEMPF